MYNKRELAAFLDGRNDPESFMTVLKRRLSMDSFKSKHADYAEKLAQLQRVGKALKVLEGK